MPVARLPWLSMGCCCITLTGAVRPASAQHPPTQTMGAMGAMSKQQALAVLQPLYAQSDQAFSQQDIDRIASFLDPGYVFVFTSGLKNPRSVYLSLDLPRGSSVIRNIHRKTTIQDVRVTGDSLVAAIEWTESSERKELFRPVWTFKLESATQEETWKHTAAGWKRVLTRTLTDEVYDPVPVETLIDHDTQILRLVCDGALTAEEQQRFATVIAEQVRQDPNRWYRNDLQVRADLESLGRGSATIRGEVWLKWRLSYAFDDVEGTRIAAAHDPIVMADRDRQVLITEHTLRSLHDAALWVAQQTGRAAPDAQSIANLRNTIRQQGRTWPVESLKALTNSVKDFPASVEVVMGLPEATRKGVLAQLGEAYGAAEPKRTLLTAALMSNMYDILVLQAEQGLLQTQAWALGRMMDRNNCQIRYAGQFTQGSGAFCAPIGKPY